ncbi:MAG: aspartate aminotransferase family protein [Vicinamibacteria bacterium]
MQKTATVSHVFSRAPGRVLPTVARAVGAEVWDTDGNRYLDGSGGAVVVNVGHGREEVADAIARQALTAGYVHGTQFTSGPLEEYARRLAPHAPAGCDRLYLVSGGSEANETAVKIARAYQRARGHASRHKVIRRSVSYHGNTLFTLSLSGRPALRAPYEPLLAPSLAVAAPFCYHCPLERTFPSCAVACADELEEVILREGPETVAAFVAEPILGASGAAAVPPEDYARRAEDTCRRYGVVYIDDEVMTGFGRTGAWFASEWSGIQPDIVTCGKGMSGGYLPVGGVLVKRAIVDLLEAAGGFVHGFTFSHHPVTAAACGAVLDILERERLVERARTLGAFMEKALDRLRLRPHVGDVRGRGLLWGVEIVESQRLRKAFPHAAGKAAAVTAACLRAGLVVYPSTGCANGTDGDAILLAPPFVATEAQLQEMVDILDHVLFGLDL